MTASIRPRPTLEPIPSLLGPSNGAMRVAPTKAHTPIIKIYY